MDEKLELSKTDGEAKCGKDLGDASQICQEIINETDRQIQVQTKFLEDFQQQSKFVASFKEKLNIEIDEMKKSLNESLDQMAESSTEIQMRI